MTCIFLGEVTNASQTILRNRLGELTWGTDLGNRLGGLGVFFKNFVKDNVVTKIHIFKNKNDFKNSGDIFFWGTNVGTDVGTDLGNRLGEQT